MGKNSKKKTQEEQVTTKTPIDSPAAAAPKKGEKKGKAVEVPVVAAAKEAASEGGPSLGAIAPFGVVAAGGAGFAAFRSGLIGGKEEREEAQETPKKGGKGKG